MHRWTLRRSCLSGWLTAFYFVIIQSPEETVIDPTFAAPEHYVMPTSTPALPPDPFCSLVSPIVWLLNTPDRFDIYSAVRALSFRSFCVGFVCMPYFIQKWLLNGWLKTFLFRMGETWACSMGSPHKVSWKNVADKMAVFCVVILGLAVQGLILMQLSIKQLRQEAGLVCDPPPFGPMT